MNIKKWLIASRSNNYHPYLIRPLGLLAVAIAMLTINITYNLTASHSIQVLGYATDISSGEIINQTNYQRQINGLPALSTSPSLTNAASAKAQDMLAYDYWAHVSPSGVQPWYFITSADYNYSTAGENLARNFDATSSVISGWMNSPEHRGNILNTSYKDIGVTVINGVMDGSETTLVVALYGSLMPVSAPQTPAPSPTTVTTNAQPEPIIQSDVATVKQVDQNSEQAPPVILARDKPVIQSKSVNVPVSSQLIKSNKLQKKDVGYSHRNGLNWAQKITLIMLSTLFLVNVLKHTLVWRTQKRGWRHIWLRSHPAAQYILILLAILVTTYTGVGFIK